MRPISFKRHRFPSEIIRHAIWLYARFTLSFRDVEELLAERGIDASYETVRRWFLKFGPSIAANIRRSRPRPSDHWHLDEMVISMRGGKYWLWRAVDNEGEVLDFLVQRRRDAQAAKKLMVKLLKKHGFAPSRVVTDRLRSYPVAFRAIGFDPDPAAATYRLYVFAGEAVPPATDTFSFAAQERVDAAAAANGVTVIDASGSRRVT